MFLGNLFKLKKGFIFSMILVIQEDIVLFEERG